MNRPTSAVDRTFYIRVLGRTLEHLGVQMYKRRDVAIAELVANCWDAGACNVWIEVPAAAGYKPESGVIRIRDDGRGMGQDDVQDRYLVVGRNRRISDGDVVGGRPVMGRKGIGKLAGFGLAEHMQVLTWNEDESTQIELAASQLKKPSGIAESVPVPGKVNVSISKSFGVAGTLLSVTGLKHKTPLDITALREALARRFSAKTRGEMNIYVNNVPLGEPNINNVFRYPDAGYATEALPSGKEVKYFYAFSKELLRSPELRGFTIHVRGKTAQAPPFFFRVEATASGQHGTRYVYGAIDADFMDEGIDDESDLVSTDRQEFDWDDPRLEELRVWGETLSRRVLREWTDRKGTKFEEEIALVTELKARIDRLEPVSKKQVSKFLRTLGAAEAEPKRAIELADSLVRAFEYRQFHDVINEIEAVADDPQQLHVLLDYIAQWKVLESRAILEVIKGRLDIIDKFHSLILNDAPETASKSSRDNLHDMLAGYPWLIHPDWQVLAEEKKVTKFMNDKADKEVADPEKRGRFDFLALADDRRLFVIEIKRTNHPVQLEELTRLQGYGEELAGAQDEELTLVLIYGGKSDVRQKNWQAWIKREDAITMTWAEVHKRTKRTYEHYRAILERNIESPDFGKKAKELAQTRAVLLSGTIHRPPAVRKLGLGPQDYDFTGSPVSDKPE